jgi:hypothetical protein
MDDLAFTLLSGAAIDRRSVKVLDKKEYTVSAKKRNERKKHPSARHDALGDATMPGNNTLGRHALQRNGALTHPKTLTALTRSGLPHEVRHASKCTAAQHDIE